MLMSTTDDRNHISNEWTHDKKLSEVDVRSNKWHKTYKNVHFSSFRHLIGLAVGRWFTFFFCPRSTWVGRQKSFFFAQRLKKNFFASILMGRSGNRKQDYFFFSGLRGQIKRFFLGSILSAQMISFLWGILGKFGRGPGLIRSIFGLIFPENLKFLILFALHSYDKGNMP